MIQNYSSLFAFVISILYLGLFVYFLAIQLYDNTRPRDRFTKLRRVILALLLVSFFTQIPSAVYQGFRAFGYEYEVLRNISTVSSNISKLSAGVLLLAVYTYRVSSDEEDK